MHHALGYALEGNLEEALTAFSGVWDEELADERRSLRRARAQLSHLIHERSGRKALYTILPPPPQTIPLTQETSKYEVPFVIDIGLPIPLVGRLDGIVQHRDTGEKWALEFKTVSRLYGVTDALDLNPQALTYALAARAVSELDIKGVMYEIMLVDPSKVESLSFPVLVPPHHLSEIHDWLRYWGRILLECEKQLEAGGKPEECFPKNFAGCSAYPLFYSPISHCEYANLCKPSDWKALTALYDVAPEHKFVELSVEKQDV